MEHPVEPIRQFLTSKLPYYLELLRQMVEINTFTANADGVNRLGSLTANEFSSLGLSSEFVQSVNPEFGRHLFIQHDAGFDSSGMNRAARKSIALISHLDTVFSPDEEKANNFFFRQEGDRIYGPGTVDIKGGTVLIFMVLDAIKTLYPQLFDQVNWLVALDASEETLSEDFGALCLERIPSDATACLVFEGGTPNRNTVPVVTSRKGRAVFGIRVNGRGAHAGNYHKQGANAIVQIAHTVQQIAALTDYGQQITFNVGVINGGSVVNRVPHYAEALVEMRAFSPEIFASGFQKMMELDGTSSLSSNDGFPCRVSVQALSQSAPWPRNARTDQLFELWRETGARLDLEVVPEDRGGLSDGNLLWNHVPVLDGLGPSGTNAHCSERSLDGSKDQEFVLVSSFIPKATLNILSILRLIVDEGE
jgi:glutamate carboxypeptidase